MSAIEPVRPRDPRLPVSPQLALRVAIIGGLAMVMFGVIFFRLWYLQILTGEHYVAQANANHTRNLPIPAPRGEILDREGRAIVTSRTTNAVEIVPGLLPGHIAAQVAAYEKLIAPAEALRRQAGVRLASLEGTLAHVHRVTAAERSEQRALLRATAPLHTRVPPLAPAERKLRALFRRLGQVLGLSPRTIDERVVQGMTATPYAHVTVKTDAGPGVLTVLGERSEEFPGVVQEPVSIRAYPYGELAAQVLGHVDQISEGELALKAFRGVPAGTVVGQEGLEFYYDGYLRGKSGVQKVQVNAAGEPVASVSESTPPQAGRSLRTTIDLGLQQEAEKALAEGKANAQASGKPANGGAFVAMDPRNGQILAMGSQPAFDPNRFAKPLTPAEYAELVGSGAAAGPLDDKAENGAYPTGSTF